MGSAVQFIANVVEAIIGLVGRALDGDEDAYRRVEEILPVQLKSELAKAKAEADAAKRFGGKAGLKNG